MADAPSDIGFLEWAIGIGASIGGMMIAAAFGHAHSRINRVEDAHAGAADGVRERAEREESRLWTAINGLRDTIEKDRRDSEAHRAVVLGTIGSMVTREDLHREMERLLQAINPKSR
jgi:hypothetical protein